MLSNGMSDADEKQLIAVYSKFDQSGDQRLGIDELSAFMTYTHREKRERERKRKQGERKREMI
jgi:uncharacterized protein (DUF2225 family)